MDRSLDLIAADFESLTPEDFDGSDPAASGWQKLDMLCDEVRDLNDPVAAAPTLLRTMERLDSVELGTPGPLVHTLESRRGTYERFLVESVRRKPTTLTVWMINRILNAAPPDAESWLELLRTAADHTEASETTKAEAAEFLQYQEKR